MIEKYIWTKEFDKEEGKSQHDFECGVKVDKWDCL